jgi:hypothetical protein
MLNAEWSDHSEHDCRQERKGHDRGKHVQPHLQFHRASFIGVPMWWGLTQTRAPMNEP